MNKTICRIGFWSGLIATIATISYSLVQLLQLSGILPKPLDEILIYGTSLCIVIPFLFEMLSLHYIVNNEKKFWSHSVLIFSILYAVFVIANYVVQLATVIPARQNGTLPGFGVLEQTPHSMFWDFDGLGYIFMGLASLAAVPLFEKRGFQKWVRISFLANAVMTPVIGFVYFYPHFSEKLLLIAFPWAITAPLSMLTLALMFRKY